MTTDWPHSDDRDFWRLYDAAVPRAAPAACPPLLELAGYIDGRLDPSAVARIELHLTGCVACRDAVSESRVTLAEMSASDAAASSLTVIRRARALRAGQSRSRHVLRRLGRWSVAAAFAVLVALGGLEAGAATSATDSSVETALRQELSFGLLNGTELDEDPLINWSAELGDDR